MTLKVQETVVEAGMFFSQKILVEGARRENLHLLCADLSESFPISFSIFIPPVVFWGRSYQHNFTNVGGHITCRRSNCLCNTKRLGSEPQNFSLQTCAQDTIHQPVLSPRQLQQSTQRLRQGHSWERTDGVTLAASSAQAELSPSALLGGFWTLVCGGAN